MKAISFVSALSAMCLSLSAACQVVGRPGRPLLNVNILSFLTPGVLRKIFEYPAATANFIDNPR